MTRKISCLLVWKCIQDSFGVHDLENLDEVIRALDERVTEDDPEEVKQNLAFVQASLQGLGIDPGPPGSLEDIKEALGELRESALRERSQEASRRLRKRPTRQH